MMRKAVYLIVALIAFICGISVFYFRLFYFPVSLSELRKNYTLFEPFEIKVVGKLEVVQAEGRYFVSLKDWDGDCRDNFCFRGLDLSKQVEEENLALLKELADKNKAHQESGLPKGEYVTDIEVTGQLIAKENSFFPGERFYDIQVKKIKQLSPVRFVTIDEIMR